MWSAGSLGQLFQWQKGCKYSLIRSFLTKIEAQLLYYLFSGLQFWIWTKNHLFDHWMQNTEGFAVSKHFWAKLLRAMATIWDIVRLNLFRTVPYKLLSTVSKFYGPTINLLEQWRGETFRGLYAPPLLAWIRWNYEIVSLPFICFAKLSQE